jgi:hypothetical protein
MKRNVTISRRSGVLAATGMEANMKTSNMKLSCRACRGISVVGVLVLIAAGTPLLQQPAVLAQCTYSSGSTGTNGVFNPTNQISSTVGWSVSNNVVTVTNSSDGVFHFTSIDIATNWVVRFTRNTLNTPVYLLAQSNVVIRGSINVDGGSAPPGVLDGGKGGPGGFDGGAAGSGGTSPAQGHGPGAGCLGNAAGFATRGQPPDFCTTNDARAYGASDIVPFIGGSGGGGDGNGLGQGGGGGAGAILIASSGTISVFGSITANTGTVDIGGPGSAGAIKLVARTIDGEGLIQAKAADPGGIFNNRVGSSGRIRLDGCSILRSSLTDPPATFGTPQPVFLATNPTIRVASIAGTNTPALPAGSLTAPDVFLPTNFVNPALIKVTASNINVGTTFKVIVTPAFGTNLVGEASLVGTYAFSSNTVSMSVYTDRVWRVNALIDYIPRP